MKTPNKKAAVPAAMTLARALFTDVTFTLTLHNVTLFHLSRYAHFGGFGNDINEALNSVLGHRFKDETFDVHVQRLADDAFEFQELSDTPGTPEAKFKAERAAAKAKGAV
jgi:hypothetical protein